MPTTELTQTEAYRRSTGRRVPRNGPPSAAEVHAALRKLRIANGGDMSLRFGESRGLSKAAANQAIDTVLQSKDPRRYLDLLEIGILPDDLRLGTIALASEEAGDDVEIHYHLACLPDIPDALKTVEVDHLAKSKNPDARSYAYWLLNPHNRVIPLTEEHKQILEKRFGCE